MPDTAEPSKVPPRKRHIFRWVFLLVTVLLIAGLFIIFKWGDSEKMPAFAKIWKLRGALLYSQIRYGLGQP